jgi:hypothetical protein
MNFMDKVVVLIRKFVKFINLKVKIDPLSIFGVLVQKKHYLCGLIYVISSPLFKIY